MAKKDIKTDLSGLDSSDKTVLIYMLQEQINLMQEKFDRLDAKYKILEGRLSKNSKNSSKPPSSDTKPPKTTSSKKKTGKKPGGQPGHKGNHLQLNKNPDEIIVLEVSDCGHCGKSLNKQSATLDKRQLFEIPEPKMHVTEYHAEHKDCSCGYTTSACFPEGVTHLTQYGPRAKSLMVYMNQYQMIPFERASEFFHTVYNHKVSPGTIVNAGGYLYERLEQVESEVAALLKKSEIIHCDETGASVNGKKQWIHTVGTNKLTHYAIHEKRGAQATEDIGILPGYSGIMIHDHWKSYFKYGSSEHALCNAHHIRELRFLHEIKKIKWAKKMSELLVNINEEKTSSITYGKECFSPETLSDYNSRYDDIIKKSIREQARRGTIDSRNLLKRLTNFKKETLLFMNNFSVPFTNNLSEQDIRMTKVKQKISGCFRNKVGGNNFCRIRGIISTCKKNNKNIFKILQQSFQKIMTVDLLLNSS